MNRRLLRALFGRLDLMRTAAGLLRLAQLTGLVSLARIFHLGDAAKLAPQVPGTFFYARGQRIEQSARRVQRFCTSAA